MRLFFLIGTLLLLQASLAQESRLKVYPVDCRSNGQSIVYQPSEIQLYQKDSLVNVSKTYSDSGFVLFNHLLQGQYELRFKNFYGIEKSHSLIISPLVENTELICVYDSKWSKWKGESFLDSLKQNEEMVISYKSSGCFHQISEELRIVRINDRFVLHHKEQIIELEKEHLSAIKIFESELKMERLNACTTQDRYLILLNNSGRSYVDGSCSWHGFNKLKEKLGLE